MASAPSGEQLREALGTIDRLRAENQALKAENQALKAQVEELSTESRALKAENGSLADRVSRLETEMNADSSTTGKPPSSDPIGPRKKRAERRAEARAEKRKQGKQPGSPGAKLERQEPDVVVPHQPSCCRACHRDLAGAEVVGEVVRQVVDLPPVRPVVTDHIAYRYRCTCGTETLGDFPPEARAPVCFGPGVRTVATYMLDRQHVPVERTAELLSDLLGVKVSTGWLCNVQAEAARKLGPFLTWLKGRLLEEPVVHADETGTAVLTTKYWVHTIATKLLALVAVHRERGSEAVKSMAVLPGYTGTIVHDGYVSYPKLTNAEHAQCGAHLLRHLKGVAREEVFAACASAVAGVLMEAKAASEAAAAAGQAAVDPELAERIRASYHAALGSVFELLPPGPKPRRRHTGGWSDAQRKAWNLATRMRDRSGEVLRLLDDTRVPFDNNEAERTLRMVKLHDKISGPFHSTDGAEAFAAVRSYLQTAAKHNENLLGVLHMLFTTGPWVPAPTGPG